MSANLKPVEKEDIITISELLSGAPTQDVQWTQGAKIRSVMYYTLTFSVRTEVATGAAPGPGDESEGLLFVQSDEYILQRIRNAAIKDQPSNFVVTEEFQYGQMDKSGKGRWLVYHNEELNMLQRRFFSKRNWTEDSRLQEIAKKFKLDGELGSLKWELDLAIPLQKF
ncbi:hypothetical protein K505DRAFT_360964 [Melanomma pulvis-pyrius CBS 109.77]|uniref:Uncharacterized protein n=1 Tax=Melanomma pulvis-pyrius CBS 109.77 TaxID=1314802 RepID=A0A6A6XDP7_9PLEO|nr:hypothetical protein K505DRAFT_360964 [Melanomma pulvis-pyrius CBS 109.77]